MKVGSTFSGYGGLDMAACQFFGADLAWVAEIEDAPSKVLATRHPEVPNLGDITKVDWSAVEPVDILTGGFPCQDVSAAGKRAGLKSGTRSGLWAELLHATETLRPKLLIAENVRGLLSAKTDTSEERVIVGPKGGRKVGYTDRALGRVLADLADIGYDARWVGLRAADAGAPHGRFRVFILAHPAGEYRHEDVAPDAKGDGRDQGWTESAGILGGSDASVDGAASPHADHQGPQGQESAGRRVMPDWGAYAPAVHRWERRIGRVAPEPTEPAPRGGRRLSPRFVEWMMGLPEGWVTDVPGVSRNDQLKMLGNGVVPQQALLALQALGAF